MTHRLFVALPIPARVRDTLDSFVTPRRDADPALRFVPAENWHLTLAFLGDVPEDRHDRLIAGLQDVATHSRELAVTLEGGGAFPHPGAARVIWLGAAHGEPGLAALARRVRQACARAAVPHEGGQFTAHLTLARAHQPQRVDRWLTIVDAIPPLSWLVSGFTLVESTLNRGGSIYRPVEEFTFGARPRPSSGTPAEQDAPRLA